MKQFVKIFALMMALALVIGILAACGDKKGGDTTGTGEGTAAETEKAGGEAKGETQTWGRYTVLIPDGYVLKGGDVFDEENTKAFNINNKDSSLTYFMFNTYDEDSCKSSIDTTKDMNEGASDVSVVYNGVTWTGVAYESIGIACFSMYADFGNGDFVLLSAAGNAYDSDTTSAILSSLVLAPAE